MYETALQRPTGTGRPLRQAWRTTIWLPKSAVSTSLRRSRKVSATAERPGSLLAKGFVLTGEDACRDRHPLETNRRGVFALEMSARNPSSALLRPSARAHRSLRRCIPIWPHSSPLRFPRLWRRLAMCRSDGRYGSPRICDPVLPSED